MNGQTGRPVTGQQRRGERPAEAVPLPETRLHEAGEVLGRALIDDPIVARAVPPSLRGTRAALAGLGLALVRHGRRFGEVYVTLGRPSVEGLAIWLPPEDRWMPVSRVARGFVLANSLGLDLLGTWRFGRVWREQEGLRRRTLAQPHWSLMRLGIDPWLAETRADAIEEMVLRPVLARADAHGVPCAATSFRAHEVLRLGRQGFFVVAEDYLPLLDAHCWILRRDPQR